MKIAAFGFELLCGMFFFFRGVQFLYTLTYLLISTIFKLLLLLCVCVCVCVCVCPGHSMSECTGETKEKQGEFDELASAIVQEKQFIFIRLCVLREVSTGKEGHSRICL